MEDEVAVFFVVADFADFADVFLADFVVVFFLRAVAVFSVVFFCAKFQAVKALIENV